MEIFLLIVGRWGFVDVGGGVLGDGVRRMLRSEMRREGDGGVWRGCGGWGFWSGGWGLVGGGGDGW